MSTTIPRTPWIDDDGSGTTGTVLNNAIKTELYDQIDVALGNTTPLPAIQTYTPTWTTGGTATTLGDGTLTGKYATLGALTWVCIHLIYGSTTATSDSNPFRFTLPPGRPITEGLVGLTGLVWSTVAFWALTTHSIGTNTYVEPLITYGNPMQSVNNARPFTWANTHHMTVYGLYY